MSRVLVLTHRKGRLERWGVETGTQRASRSRVPLGGGLGRFCPSVTLLLAPRGYLIGRSAGMAGELWPNKSASNHKAIIVQLINKSRIDKTIAYLGAVRNSVQEPKTPRIVGRETGSWRGVR